jgi:hypothetical protein
LEDDDNKKSFYKTTAGGYRLSTSRGSRATGEHPDFIIRESSEAVIEKDVLIAFYRAALTSDSVCSRSAYSLMQ